MPQKNNRQGLPDSVYQAVVEYLEVIEQTNRPIGLYKLIMDKIEPVLLNTVLQHTDYHLGNTADLLGISRSTLKRRMQRYRINN